MKIPKKQTRARRSEIATLPQAIAETAGFGSRLPQNPLTTAPNPGMRGISQKYSLRAMYLDDEIVASPQGAYEWPPLSRRIEAAL